jgi:secreted trypsin-like serine protease
MQLMGGRITGLVVAALLTALPARAIVELDSSFGVTDGNYTALGADYPAVGEFTGLADSGVLIEGDWVLTAAHVAGGLSAGSIYQIGGNNYTVASTIINPAYNGTDLDADIALVRLTSNVTNVTPATLYTGSSELATVGTWVGFGQSGTGLTGSTTPRGTLRGETNDIDLFYDPVSGDFSLLSGTDIVSDFDDGTVGNNTLFPYSSPTPTAEEGGLAPGDSGGGVFATIAGSTVLIGVNDFVAAGNGTNTQYGALSGATRVSSYASWINSEVTPVPEPGSMAAVAGLAALMAGLTRRRGRIG